MQEKYVDHLCLQGELEIDVGHQVELLNILSKPMGIIGEMAKQKHVVLLQTSCSHKNVTTINKIEILNGWNESI